MSFLIRFYQSGIAAAGRRGFFLIAATMVFTSCATVSMPDLGTIYSKAARAHGPGRNPVIVIPGILGSQLVDGETGRVAWGAFGSGSANPNRPSDARLLALPMGKQPLSGLRDGLTAPAALDRARLRLMGLPIDLVAYANLLGVLGAGGYLDESFRSVDYGKDHYTCFQFPYDWRRDNIENARLLHTFILQKKAEVEAENLRRFGHTGAPVKFDIVAHSMGGLVARYMLMYGGDEPGADGTLPPLTWRGARNVDKVLLVAPPNDGSLLALQQLLTGFRPAPILPQYPAALLGTMPAVYQLLPDPALQPVIDAQSGQALDYLDPAVWEEQQWGLLNPAADKTLVHLLPDIGNPEERRTVAKQYLQTVLQRAQVFRAALQRPHRLPKGLQLHLYAGDAVGTPAALAVSKAGRLDVTDWAPGDGTVLRASALGDRRTPAQQAQSVRSFVPWTQVMFLQTSHLGLTKDPTFADNVLYTLLLSPQNP